MWLFLSGLLVALVGDILTVVSRLKDKPLYYLTGILFVFIGGVLIGLSVYENLPTALDVYRGRTELEITEVVRDTVVVKRDTVVIFKENIKNLENL